MKTTDSGSLDLTLSFIRKLVRSVREMGAGPPRFAVDSAGILCLPEGRGMTLSSSAGADGIPVGKGPVRTADGPGSHDSAIDTDSMEWGNRSCEFEKGDGKAARRSFLPSSPQHAGLRTEVRGGGRPSHSATQLHGCELGGQLLLPGRRCILCQHLSEPGSIRSLASCVPGRCWQCGGRHGGCASAVRGVDHSCSELSSWGPEVPVK